MTKSEIYHWGLLIVWLLVALLTIWRYCKRPKTLEEPHGFELGTLFLLGVDILNVALNAH